MASAFTPEDLKALSLLISNAIKQSGSTNPRNNNQVYNAVSNHSESPEKKAQAIRDYKQSDQYNKLIKEANAENKELSKRLEALSRLVDANTKIMNEVISSHSNIEKSEEVLAKALNKAADRANQDAGSSVKALIGNIQTLEDALRASDTAHETAALVKAMSELARGENKLSDYMKSMESIKDALSKNGKSLSDFDSNIASMDESLHNLLIQAGAKKDPVTGHIDLNSINEDMQQFVNGLFAKMMQAQEGQTAINKAETIARETNIVVMQGNANAYKKLTNIVSTAGERFNNWAVQVTKSAFVVDALASAVKHLYSNMMAAANTGTQRTFGEVLSNNKRAIVNGIDPNVLQQIQAKNAGARAIAGRSNFDDEIVASKDFLSVTGDRGEATKAKAELLQTMSGLGVKFTDATAKTGAMAKTMGQLQYLTGQTSEQLSTMTAELANDNDFRQSMFELGSKERAQALQSINELMVHNKLMGMSNEMASEMFKLDYASKHKKPKDRLKSAAQMDQLEVLLGIKNGTVGKVMREGGIENHLEMMRKKGASEDDIAAERTRYNDEYAEVAKRVNQEKNATNADGSANMPRQLAMQGYEDIMPESSEIFNTKIDPKAMEANKIQGKAAEDMKQAGKDMLGASLMMRTGNAISTLLNGPFGALIQGGMAYAMIKAIKPFAGVLMKSLGSFGGKIGSFGKIAGALTMGKSMWGAAANTAKAAAPAAWSFIKDKAVGGAATVAAETPGLATKVWGATKAATTVGLGKIMPIASSITNIAAAAAKSVPTKVLSGGASALGVLSKGLKFLGPVMAAGSLVLDATDKKESRFEKAINMGISGAELGGVGGAAFAGVGAIPGAIIGGLTGATAGYFMGNGEDDQKVNPGVASDPSQPSVAPGTVGDPAMQDSTNVNPDGTLKVGNKDRQQIVKDANGNVQQLNDPQGLTPSERREDTSMKVYQTLNEILVLLEKQFDNMGDYQDTQIKQQDRFRRALQNYSINSADMSASQQIN